MATTVNTGLDAIGVETAARREAQRRATVAAARGGMPVGEILRVALEALRVNKMRSLLTMLGIIIGVSAVIAMQALGNGAQQAVNARIASLGTTLVTINPGQVFTGGIASATDRARLRVEDAEALVENGRGFVAVQPEMGRQLQVQYLNTNTSVNVIGTSANYPTVRKYTIGAGEMFDEGADAGRKRVAVLGATTAANLGFASPEAAVGQEIRVGGTQFTILGVFAPKGGATGFNDPDDQVVIPLGTARFRVIGSDNLRSINILAPSEDQINATMAEAQRVLRREHRLPAGRPDDFQIRNQADFLTTAAETSQVFTYLLLGVATVSLLVGGIGIMNIMLVSVTERTREVGVRKALGATRATILSQFLIEAIVLCVLGGIIGILLGIGMATGLRVALGWTTSVATSSIVVAFTFSAVVGLVFGVWPARRAASLDPIIALRYE
ncbi:ABC transporter permease [Roseisolibacter sp. H3M3-2]|uniref:ABC transporter permease n=1 Tax=Roseisolibacter sp. H3M3-2 TaxID=3031323 RepID=UPI0023DA3413|nr:ABC transporter permease [Roseisolibacter sp. H3M3-2]MDF1503566.1 ABC transporter permease [Roseisolibacter sp. H3M3-2]